jgi:sRNA-binding carbon storage regulator CsrA
MLILTRRPGESLLIEPNPEITSAETWTWFIRPIEVHILRIEGKHVRVGIDAVTELRITRTEARRDGP